MFLFSISLFLSCNQNVEKKEEWAVIVNFFTPDSTYYPPTKKFPFPDSLQFGSLENFFTNEDKTPVISDSTIIFYDNYRANGNKQCCIKDTLQLYIDSIKGKKYLFAIGDYIAVFQSDSYSDSNLRTRKKMGSLPLGDIQLNVPYPEKQFSDEYEKLGTKLVKLSERFDEVSKQKFNDSILVETIQFANSTDRIITSVYKDMHEQEVDSIINQLKNTFPSITYEEVTEIDSDGKPSRLIRMQLEGIAIAFKQTNETEYSFTLTDYYETIKLILRNAGTGYVFRDDVSIH